jgi:MFS transporter, UMF1 family
MLVDPRAADLRRGVVTGGDHRLAILLTGVYFVAGLLLLSGIDAGRGRQAALQGSRGEN